mgnify:CR=1 FL=1|jgi:hypothetical protein|tara:strand:- start:172 stop:540 length:369 start_codon:yes stop_codon:yes gene_type:complete
MSDDFDFGFTAVDDIPTSTTTTSEPVQATLPEGSLDVVMDKLEQLESRILSADNTGMINEHRALLEADVTGKLKDVELLILPLLQNLKKNPEKDYIHWPNRTAIIDKQIEKILAVTRYFERI